MIQNLLIDVAGVATALGVYATARALGRRFGTRRRVERRDRLDGLLAPYDRMTVMPIPVRDELPANVYHLRRR